MTDAVPVLEVRAPSSPPVPWVAADFHAIERRVARISQALGFPITLEYVETDGTISRLVVRACAPRGSGRRARAAREDVPLFPAMTRVQLANNVHTSLCIACLDSLLGGTPSALLQPFEEPANPHVRAAAAHLKMAPGTIFEQIAGVPPWTPEREAAREEAEEADEAASAAKLTTFAEALAAEGVVSSALKPLRADEALAAQAMLASAPSPPDRFVAAARAVVTGVLSGEEALRVLDFAAPPPEPDHDCAELPRPPRAAGEAAGL